MKGAEKKWDSVELFSRYEFFLEMFIESALAYLKEVVDEGALRMPSLMLELFADNQGGNCHHPFLRTIY